MSGAPVTDPVIIGAGDALGLKVINTFDLSEIDVTKKIAGPGAKLGADKAFTVALACTSE